MGSDVGIIEGNTIHIEEPIGANVFTSQGAQDVNPVEELYVSTPHGGHSFIPISLPAVPRGQGEQDVKSPPVEYVPTSQRVHENPPTNSAAT